MNSIASRIVGSLCMLGVIVAIGWLIVTPIKKTHEERVIDEARVLYEGQVKLRERQEKTIAEVEEEMATIVAEKTAREEEIASLEEEKVELAREMEAITDKKEALIEAMNDRARKNREAYLGRKFERFEPGNGRIYRDVEVASVSDEGIQLRNELGLRTVRAEDLGENFQLRFRFGLLPEDKPLPVNPAESEE